MELYPAQQAAVEMFRKRHDSRLLLVWGTGCGKTATAIRCLQTLPSAKRILVVCPAIVRRHWVREMAAWGGLEATPVEVGRKCKLSRARDEVRRAAYAAPIQVVSYALLGEVNFTEWDAIVFDEIHHLGRPESTQSRNAMDLMVCNPRAAVLGLSATLIPTDARQLWHPIHLLWRNILGTPTRRGGVSWSYMFRYFDMERDEYGWVSRGLKDGAGEWLRERLAPLMHRLTRDDLADCLPPLDVRPLAVARGTKPVVAASDWLRALPADISRAVILTYHRDTARGIAEAARSLRPDLEVSYCDGTTPTAERDAITQLSKNSNTQLLIGTSESLREGIRLAWAQMALIVEWRATPAAAVQVLGRFSAVGRAGPCVEVVVSDDSYDASRRLLARVRDVNSVLRASSVESAVETVFASGVMSDNDLAAAIRESIGVGNLDYSEWQDSPTGSHDDL